MGKLLKITDKKHILPIINRTVSGLNGLQVPLDSAAPNSSAFIKPLLSLSTLNLFDIRAIVHKKNFSNSYL